MSTRLPARNRQGRALANETAKRFLLTQLLLVQYAKPALRPGGAGPAGADLLLAASAASARNG